MHSIYPIGDDLITAFSKTIELFGLSTLEARQFAYLYLKNEPQTLDEMSEALGKSKTAMSTGIRSLADLQLASQVWRKGTRKDLYVANRQLFKAFMNFYFRKWTDKTEQQKEALEEIIDRAKDATGPEEELQELLERTEEIIKFHEQIEAAFISLREGNGKK